MATNLSLVKLEGVVAQLETHECSNCGTRGGFSGETIVGASRSRRSSRRPSREDHPFLKPHRANMKDILFSLWLQQTILRATNFHVKSNLLRISIRLDSFQKSGQTPG